MRQEEEEEDNTLEREREEANTLLLRIEQTDKHRRNRRINKLFLLSLSTWLDKCKRGNEIKSKLKLKKGPTNLPTAFFDALISMISPRIILSPLMITVTFTNLILGLEQAVRVCHDEKFHSTWKKTLLNS